MELTRGQRGRQRGGQKRTVALPECFIRGYPEHDHHHQQALQEQHQQQHVPAEIFLSGLWGDQAVGPTDPALQGEIRLQTAGEYFVSGAQNLP